MRSYNYIHPEVLLLTLLLGLMPIKSIAQESLTVAIEIVIKQRSSYTELIAEFTKETGIKVNLEIFLGSEYKRDILSIIERKNRPDVMHWHGGQRFFSLIENDLVMPISNLWERNQYDNDFSKFKDAISYHGEVYAIPFSFYGWGLYYNIELVNRYGGIPKDWPEFLALCKKISDAGIVPIAIGAKDDWSVAAWFDYLNLRINGLDFHKNLLLGDISFRDYRVKKVLVEWKKLIDNKFFMPNAINNTWDSAFPYLFWNKAAFSLVGNFASVRFGHNKHMNTTISYMAFPKISDIPRYEDAPTEVFFIPKKAKNIVQAKKFLEYISRPLVQEKLNNSLGYFSPHHLANNNPPAFLKKINNVLKGAQGLAQYYDRDTLPLFEQITLPLFVKFIEDGDIKNLIDSLEKHRKAVLKETQ